LRCDCEFQAISAITWLAALLVLGGGGIPQLLPPNAPPAFLLVTDDDDHTTAVLKLFTLYRAAKLPVQVHVFTGGQHAFGMGSHSRVTTIKD
jgi:acetyl esterase/lipase